MLYYITRPLVSNSSLNIVVFTCWYLVLQLFFLKLVLHLCLIFCWFIIELQAFTVLHLTQTARKVAYKLARKCVWGCSVLFNSVVEPQLVRRVFFLWLLRFCFFDSNGQEFTVRAPESVAAAIVSELENRDARAARLEHSK